MNQIRRRTRGSSWAGRLVLVAAAVAVGALIAAAAGAVSTERRASQDDLSPAAIQTRVNDYNVRLDACMRANGAKRIEVPPSGWTYAGEAEVAMAACDPLIREAEAYVDAPSVQEVAVSANYLAFVQCLQPTLAAMAPAARFGAAETSAVAGCASATAR